MQPQPTTQSEGEWTRDLIKSLGPAVLALLGTIITAAVTLAQ
jgi:hypothetical protein